MASVDIHNVGSIGLIRDIKPHLLPPEAWSDVQNIRFQDNKARRIQGTSVVFDPPSVPPYWALPVRGVSDYYWLYAGLNKVFVFDGATHTDITRATGGDYAATEINTWNGGQIGGVPYLNNGVDPPQYWGPITPAEPLKLLLNWPADTTAMVIRTFKNFLVALDVTQGTVRYPHRIMWSSNADPGSLPLWVPAPTNNAGMVDRTGKSEGFMVDCLPLGDINVVYKEHEAHGMQLIGGPGVFRFFDMPSGPGLLTTHCVGHLRHTARHFLHNGEELVLYDGQRVESALDKRLRSWLQQTMDSSRYNRCFVVPNPHQNEMWFCFPSAGEVWPNVAVIWNELDNTATIREIDPAAYIAPGKVVETQNLDWASATYTWESATFPWNTFRHKEHERRLLQVDPVRTKLYYLDDDTTFLRAGFSENAYLERTGLAIVGRDRQGNPKVDWQSLKTVKRIWPKISGGPVSVRVGGQFEPEGPIQWLTAQTFDGTKPYLDFFGTWRFPAVRFESVGNVGWSLEGYDLDLDVSAEL